MNERDARRVAGEWLGLADQAAVPDLYSWVALSLQDMFSEDAAACAVNTGANSAIIVALEHGMLIVLEPQATDSGARLNARALPLNDRTSILLEETLSEDPPSIVRTRTWSFRQEKEEVTFTTIQSLKAMFIDEAQPPPIEVLARAAAGRLGWQVPS